MSSNDRKDLEELFDRAKAQGWTVERTMKSHFKLYPPDPTKPMVVCSGTPSNPKSAMTITIGRMRRSGFKDRT
jgi:hypothetical protein